MEELLAHFLMAVSGGVPEDEGGSEAECADGAEEDHHGLVADGVEGAGTGLVVQPAGQEIGPGNARILYDEHDAERSAEPVGGDKFAGQGPHYRWHEGEADAEEDRGEGEAAGRGGHDGDRNGKEQGPEGEHGGVAANAITEPSEGGGGDDAGEEDVAVHGASGGEGEAVGVLEVFDGEGAAESEDDGVVEDAEQEQKPVGLAEVQEMAEEEGFGFAFSGGGTAVDGPVDDSGGKRYGGHDGGDDQRRLPPLGIGLGEEFRGHIGRVGAEAAGAQGDAHCESEMAGTDVVGDGGGGGDIQGFGSDAEEEATSGHGDEGGAPGRESGSEEADGGGPKGNAGRAEAVDEQASDEDENDVGEAIDGVKHPDLGIGEATLAMEEIGDGADGVVDVVVPVKGDGEES